MPCSFWPLPVCPFDVDLLGPLPRRRSPDHRTRQTHQLRPLRPLRVDPSLISRHLRWSLAGRRATRPGDSAGQLIPARQLMLHEVVSVRVPPKGHTRRAAATARPSSSQDIAYYLRVFRDELKRDPTTVECFDLAQAKVRLDLATRLLWGSPAPAQRLGVRVQRFFTDVRWEGRWLILIYHLRTVTWSFK